MPTPPRTAWCRLVAALAVVLGVLCGPAATASAAATTAPDQPRTAAFAQDGPGSPAPPGCGDRTPHGDSDHPATPPRPSVAHELSATLVGVRAPGDGAWHVHDAPLAVSPERGPPPLAPPTPVDLSVLRV
ncbi:hypothetical protein [Streptomyces sp. NPDC050504]|uniref:hypothetical protein n=1 Tax=Streptomyces sp. NPDC050504 TaxID=3365618 RepID=UPI0037A16D47